jgi:hypothetical protein
MGSLAAVDEITMVVMPDIMTLAGDDGDDVRLRDLQGKMIAHRERRRPYGDPRRAAKPAPAGDPRAADGRRRYDSKFAALYYPWIKS